MLKFKSTIFLASAFTFLLTAPGCREEELFKTDDQGGTVTCLINGVEHRNEVFDVIEQVFSGKPVDAQVHSDSLLDFAFHFSNGGILHFNINLREDPRASTFALPRTYLIKQSPDTYFTYLEESSPRNSCLYGLEGNDVLTVTLTSLDLDSKVADGKFHGAFGALVPSPDGVQCGAVQISEGEFSVSLSTYPN